MVSIDNNGQIYLGETKIEQENIITLIAELAENGTDERIYLRADASSDYGAVMKIMGVLSKAGYSKIGLITSQEQGQ